MISFWSYYNKHNDVGALQTDYYNDKLCVRCLFNNDELSEAWSSAEHLSANNAVAMTQY